MLPLLTYNKLKVRSILILIGLFFITITTTHAQIIKTKDGVPIGYEQDFIKSCVEGFGYQKQLNRIAEIPLSAEQNCACFVQIFEQVYSWELLEAMQENNYEILFEKEENLEILMDCVAEMEKQNPSIMENTNFSSFTEFQEKVFLRECSKEIITIAQSELEVVLTQHELENLADSICNCTLTNLIASGFSVYDFADEDLEHSSVYNEAVEPCFINALSDILGEHSFNYYDKSDILGSASKSVVSLNDGIGGELKVKVNIAGYDKYFTLDTGASDMIINRHIERDLLLDGIIQRSDYLGEMQYILADNTIVTGQLVRINKVQIGDFIVNNVVVGVVDNASLLIGTSFLDKFRDWSLNRNTKELILYR